VSADGFGLDAQLAAASSQRREATAPIPQEPCCLRCPHRASPRGTVKLPLMAPLVNRAVVPGSPVCACSRSPCEDRLGRELLLPSRLDVLDLVHGLAQAREFPVHLLPRAVGVPQRLVLWEAVPRVVAKNVRERELLVRVKTLGAPR